MQNPLPPLRSNDLFGIALRSESVYDIPCNPINRLSCQRSATTNISTSSARRKYRTGLLNELAFNTKCSVIAMRHTIVTTVCMAQLLKSCKPRPHGKKMATKEGPDRIRAFFSFRSQPELKRRSVANREHFGGAKVFDNMTSPWAVGQAASR